MLFKSRFATQYTPVRIAMTPSEKEKMLAGELYRSTDAELQSLMAEAQRQLRQLNGIANEDCRAAVHGVAGDARAGRDRHADQVTIHLRLWLTHPHRS